MGWGGPTASLTAVRLIQNGEWVECSENLPRTGAAAMVSRPAEGFDVITRLGYCWRVRAPLRLHAWQARGSTSRYGHTCARDDASSHATFSASASSQHASPHVAIGSSQPPPPPHPPEISPPLVPPPMW
jgi:hypothetical protein